MSTPVQQILAARLAAVVVAGNAAANHPFMPADGRDAIRSLVDLAIVLVDEVCLLRNALQTPGLQFPTLPDA